MVFNDRNSLGQKIPTERTSYERMNSDIRDALKFLIRTGNEDLVEILGLDNR